MRVAAVLYLVLLAVPASASDPTAYDQRFGVVATDSSGWNGPVMPMQGPQFFDAVGCAWWYNYTPRIESNQVPGLMLFWPGYQRLYMFWRATASTSEAQIRDYAAAAKGADPTRTIWWAMSNEPNDLGQANQSAASFARIYLKHHKNLRIGDPTCKIMGPGLLNWRFTNASCYQTGKDWYEEFRNAWAADPECVAYSQSVNGTNYPPQDAFSLHSYHLAWPADDWKWCRDDMQACYNDLQTYPETVGLKIWNTEYGSLTSPTRTQAADMLSALTLWMRDQPWMGKWFLFFTHSDRYATFTSCELFDDYGQPTELAKAYRAIAELPEGASFFHYPYHLNYDQAADYIRAGWTKNTAIVETLNAPGFRLHLTNGVHYQAQSARARRIAPSDGAVYKVSFNYLTNYDNSKCLLAMDTSRQISAWQVDTYGSGSDYVEIDLRDDPVEWVSLGLFVKTGFTYTQPTGEWQAIVSNVTLHTCPKAPTVIDEGAVTTSPNSLGASWSTSGGAQPISEYEYAIGTAPGLGDVADWTSAGQAMSAVRSDLALVDGVTYYFSVRARDSQGNWGPIGSSDGIVKLIPVRSIAEGKGLQAGSWLAVEDLVVSAVFPDRFYAQHQDRCAGIAVAGGSDVEIGDRVTIGGRLEVADGEAVVVGSVLASDPGAPPASIALTSTVSGGGSFGIQPAVIDRAESDVWATGLCSVGLLVTLFGETTHVDALGRFIYIDDGAGLSDGFGPAGVRIDTAGMPLPAPGSYVRATGAMSTHLIGGRPARLLRPRSIDDLWYERVGNYLSNGGFETGSAAPWTVDGTGWSIPGGTWYMGITPHSGERFFGVYGNYATHSGALRQTVAVPGGYYRASVWSRVLHGANSEEAARSRIGIDPTGGEDPSSANVLWSAWDSQEAWYHSEWRELATPAAYCPSGPVTVFLQYAQQEESGWHINCFDTAVLASVE
mgnify:CR=1 FL=1